MERTQYDQRELAAPGGPPPLLLWLAVVFLFLLIVLALAGFSYFSGGQRLATLIPYAGVAVAGLALLVIGGSLVYRRRLPRLFWLWTTIGVLILLGVGGVAGVWAYRNVLPPRFQEQALTEIPFLRALMPPTPQGGVVPTVAAPGEFSVDDLLSVAPLAEPTAEAPAAVEVTEEETETVMVATATPSPTAIPPTETTPPTTAATATTAATEVAVVPTTEPTVQVVVAQPTSAPALVGTDATGTRYSTPIWIYGLNHVQQGWNNCGPANITMALSYYGWREDQDYAASFLRPDEEDKNVSPSELVQFVNEQTGVRAITRIGGDIGLLKEFIVAQIPVIIERSYTPEGYDWIGHYQTVVGFDDNARTFYVYDSYLGTGVAGSGLPETYDEFDDGWQAFNRVFIAIYPQDQEATVQRILGARADLAGAAEIALETARTEARADRQNPFVWFNVGTALTRLGQYEDAARAYDESRRLELPFRMLWYQFGMFEALYEVGRYDDVLSLVNVNLANGGQYVEETYYWQGRALEALGRTQEAVTAYQRAIARNPRYAAAQQALNNL